MTPDQGIQFMKALGSFNPQKSGKWIRTNCPLAFKLHKNHKDNNPSFGLTVEADKPSRFNCFSCMSGSALDLIQALEFHNAPKGNFKLAREILEAEQLEVVPLPEYGEFANSGDSWIFTPWPDYYLEDYPHVGHVPVAMEYLESRGMPVAQSIALDLRFDYTKSMICFPIREAYGQLAGMRGRTILGGKEGWEKHYDYSWNGSNNVKGVWYNEQSLHLPGKVVVVEGQFDVAKVLQRYPKCVGNLTAKPSPMKIHKLALTEGVVYIPDNDETGERSAEIYVEELTKLHVPVSVCHLPTEVKDAGDCHPDFLYDLIVPYL